MDQSAVEGNVEDVDREAIEKLIGRLRDASLALVKFDGLAIAAMATLVSVLKLEQKQALDVAVSYIWIIQGLGFLLASSIVVWGGYVVMDTEKQNSKQLSRGVFLAKALFMALVMAHTGGMAYTLGTITAKMVCCKNIDS